MSRALVFGCGGVGRKCRTYLEKHGAEVIAYADNDKRKWGGVFDGIEIIPPEMIASMEYSKIAIGNYKAADSIKRQLIKLGVEEQKIIIPFIPKKIFFNDRITVSNDVDENNDERESGLTKWYQGLGLKIIDAELLAKLRDLKSVLHKYNIPTSEVCIVSGAVLQVLGLRKSKIFDDIDIIMSSPYRDLYGKGLVIVSETCEMHPQNEYDVSDDQIISDRDAHFCFHGLKFMDPLILYRQRVKMATNEETYLLERFLLKNARL